MTDDFQRHVDRRFRIGLDKLVEDEYSVGLPPSKMADALRSMLKHCEDLENLQEKHHG